MRIFVVGLVFAFLVLVGGIVGFSLWLDSVTVDRGERIQRLEDRADDLEVRVNELERRMR